MKEKIIFAVLLCIQLGCSNEKKEETAIVKQEQQVVLLPDNIDFNFHVKPILSDRCFHCHGPDEATRQGNLGLHSKELAFSKVGDNKDHYAIIAGDTTNSTLIQRIFSNNKEDIMPPVESNLQLSEYEKGILKKWIAQGAEWKSHWSFLPPKNDIPVSIDSLKTNNEIDLFVLKKLKEAGLSPSKKAKKEKLIRRASFDLRGLPPTLEEINAFVNDQSNNAFEKVIDNFLSSKAYAERMTKEWLDVARYADTHGYQDDFERTMWPWRDWVINAFDKNMPYDQFVTDQLAGDMVRPKNLEKIVASAFNRNHKITFEAGIIDEEYRVEYVSDRAQTFGTAFLGLTVECAKCHDHKYDPITQKNYYELFSFFNNVDENGLEINGQTPKPYVKLTKRDIEKLDFINHKEENDLHLMVMKEMKKNRQAYILGRGIYDNHKDKVSPNAPGFILPFEGFQKNRLGLTKWLFDDNNPLTSRVMVNRLWQQLFGNGIVSSSFDFGNQGSLPSHPALLDHLALKFKNEGWDIKKMLKYIMMSATYQQSSIQQSRHLELDPDNIYLARAPRIRLEAEMLRDQALAISGLLNTEIGGPSVKPYQPEGIWAEKTGGGQGKVAKYVQDTGKDLYRRSLYTYWKRTVPPPAMMTLDATTRDLCTVKRQKTNTPLQALVLLNDPQLIEAARHMALNASKKYNNLESQITYLFEISTSRKPTNEELKFLTDFYIQELARFKEKPEDAISYLSIGESEMDINNKKPEMAAIALVANTILNLDESTNKG